MFTMTLKQFDVMVQDRPGEIAISVDKPAEAQKLLDYS
jgi:hypothetical protein